jgi:hypothetical protein
MMTDRLFLGLAAPAIDHVWRMHMTRGTARRVERLPAGRIDSPRPR